MNDAEPARVSGLFVYPLKSAGGIALDTAELDAFGIRNDRRWMVVDDAGTFLTQRDAPSLALVRTALDGDRVGLHASGLDPVVLDPARTVGPLHAVGVWGDTTAGIDAGDEAAAFISTAIGRAARILHMPNAVVRPVPPEYARDGERVSFADAFPLLLIGQASLDALNARLDAPLPMNRFRPNIVVTGTAPHAEDTWRDIRIGAIPAAVVKPCARCVTTTIDQETGRAGHEPLRTLATYRKVDSKVFFGQNVIHYATGRIALGDAVTIASVTGAPAVP